MPKLIFSGKEIIVVWNKHDVNLGTIYYWKPWKCHVWEQTKEILMSKDCLKQVHEKLVELDEWYKKQINRKAIK